MRRPNLIFVLVVMVLVLTIEVFRSNKYTSESFMYKMKAREEEIQDRPEPNDLTAFLAEMYRRSLHVHTQCVAGASAVSHSAVRNFVVPDKGQSLLFCPIYKAASSTWLMAMLQMKGFWGPKNTPIQLNDIRKSVYAKLTGFDPHNQAGQFKTRFMVVRHPLERLLSCYRDKYENARKAYYYRVYGKKMLQMFRERPPGLSSSEANTLLAKADGDPERERTLGNPYANPVGPTFTEFVQYVVGPYSDDEHWRPYHTHCAPCSIEYNFILRFEDIDKESQLFLQYLEAPPDVQARKENVFPGPPTAEVSCSYYSQLSPKLMLDLIRKYEPDFRLFEYSADPYLQCADEYVRQ